MTWPRSDPRFCPFSVRVDAFAGDLMENACVGKQSCVYRCRYFFNPSTDRGREGPREGGSDSDTARVSCHALGRQSSVAMGSRGVVRARASRVRRVR